MIRVPRPIEIHGNIAIGPREGHGVRKGFDDCGLDVVNLYYLTGEESGRNEETKRKSDLIYNF